MKGSLYSGQGFTPGGGGGGGGGLGVRSRTVTSDLTTSQTTSLLLLGFKVPYTIYFDILYVGNSISNILYFVQL